MFHALPTCPSIKISDFKNRNRAVTCFGYLLALGRGTGSNVNDRNVAEGGALRFDTLVTTAEVASSADTLKRF